MDKTTVTLVFERDTICGRLFVAGQVYSDVTREEFDAIKCADGVLWRVIEDAPATTETRKRK